jgi:hypothetical protein
MTAFVKVVTPAQYQEWLKQQAADIKAANIQVTVLRQALTQSGNL